MAPSERKNRSWLRPASLRTVRLGLVGQVLTFAAMVLPIVLRQDEQIIALVFASAVASSLLGVATLGYAFVFPVIRGRRLAATASALSAIALTAASLLLLPATLAEARLGLPAWTFASTALLLWTQGLYTMLIAGLIRGDDTTGLSWARLLYGIVLLTTVTLASVLPAGPLGLVIATSVAYLVTVVSLLATREALPRHGDLPGAAARRRLARLYVRRVIQPTLTGLAGGWAFLMAGLSLPGLGAYAAPWAIVSRICGGYGTLLQAVLAPPIEARMARSVREQDPVGLMRSRRSALYLGVVVTALAVTTSMGLAVYGTGVTEARSWFVPILVVTVLFWGSQLAVTPINRLLNFLGRHRARLICEALRAGGLTAALVFTDGIARLMVMGAILAATSIALLPLTRSSKGAPRRWSRPWVTRTGGPDGQRSQRTGGVPAPIPSPVDQSAASGSDPGR